MSEKEVQGVIYKSLVPGLEEKNKVGDECRDSDVTNNRTGGFLLVKQVNAGQARHYAYGQTEFSKDLLRSYTGGMNMNVIVNGLSRPLHIPCRPFLSSRRAEARSHNVNNIVSKSIYYVNRPRR